MIERREVNNQGKTQFVYVNTETNKFVKKSMWEEQENIIPEAKVKVSKKKPILPPPVDEFTTKYEEGVKAYEESLEEINEVTEEQEEEITENSKIVKEVSESKFRWWNPISWL